MNETDGSRNPSTVPKDSRDVRTDFKTGGSRCTARSSRTGEPCKRPAMLGGNVCRAHGGAAPQVKAKAQRRLQQAADALVQKLLGFALDGDAPDHVALAAIRDALDRAGVSAKHAVGVELTMKPHEQLFDGIAIGITRAESRERRGLPAPDPEEVVDAEVVEDTPSHAPAGRTPGDRADDPNHRPAFATDDVGPPGNALMTMEEATAGQARYISSHRIRKYR